MVDEIPCPIWGTPASKLEAKAYGDRARLLSPRSGGEYVLSGSVAASVLKTFDTSAKLRLTNWLVEQRGLGERAPYIDSEILNRLKDERNADLTTNQRYERLLDYLETAARHIGDTVHISGTMDGESTRVAAELLAHTGSLADAELHFLLHQGKIAGHIEEPGTHGWFRLTLAGHNHVAQRRTKRVDSRQAFVAMWFHSSMADIYDSAIAPAIVASGYTSMRIDRKEHSNKVDDEIVAEIRRSRFLVADFTSERDKPRGGVYFEAGFAQGLGIPVIWTCKVDLIDQLHFDTRQFNHIVWDDAASLKSALRNRIVAVVGPGPLQDLP